MINWGLVGCGDIADKRIAPAIKSLPESRLIAVMSPYREEVETFQKKHGIDIGYVKLEHMMENKEINAVYVATPVFMHYDIALKAIKAGRHVLVEKPMGMNNEECLTLIKQADKNKVKLGVSYYRRFFPKVAEVKKIIREGIIGEVIQSRILYNTWYNPEKDTPKYWRVIKDKSGGGPLWDMGSHKFDMLVDILGMPISAYGILSTLSHDYEVEDSCSAVLEMDNGAHCLASFNWNSKIWCDEFEILGTEGKIIMNPCDSENLEIRLNPRIIKGIGSELTRISIYNHHNVHYPLIDDFINAIAEGSNPKVSGEEGYKTNRILAAIEQSFTIGKKVLI